MDMRRLMRVVETAQEDISRPIPATDANISAAWSFLMHKWRERAAERGRDEPADLSGACKFASLFAARVFSERVRGHFFHQWCEIPDEGGEGRRLDLAGGSAEVTDLRAGRLPASLRTYAAVTRIKPPTDLYAHDPKHMSGSANRDSMASVEPQVARWAAEFLRGRRTP